MSRNSASPDRLQELLPDLRQPPTGEQLTALQGLGEQYQQDAHRAWDLSDPGLRTEIASRDIQALIDRQHARDFARGHSKTVSRLLRQAGIGGETYL